MVKLQIIAKKCKSETDEIVRVKVDRIGERSAEYVLELIEKYPYYYHFYADADGEQVQVCVSTDVEGKKCLWCTSSDTKENLLKQLPEI